MNASAQIIEALVLEPRQNRTQLARRVGCSGPYVSIVAKRNGFPDVSHLKGRGTTSREIEREYVKMLNLLRELYECISEEGIEVEPVLKKVEAFLHR